MLSNLESLYNHTLFPYGLMTILRLTCDAHGFAIIRFADNMTTSSNGNIFRVTAHLCEEFPGHRRISLTKASDAELYVYFAMRLKKMAEKTIGTSVIWDAIALIMTSL